MPMPFSQVLAMAKQESQAKGEVASSGLISKGKMQAYLDVVCAEGGVSEPMIELAD